MVNINHQESARFARGYPNIGFGPTAPPPFYFLLIHRGILDAVPGPGVFADMVTVGLVARTTPVSWGMAWKDRPPPGCIT